MQRHAISCGGRALKGLGGLPLTKPYQTANAVGQSVAVRQWGLSFIVERETAQTTSEGPEVHAQWKRLLNRKNSQEVGLEAATL